MIDSTVLRAAESAGEVLSDAVMVVIIGMVVVFAMLIFLILVFWTFGKIMERGTNRGGERIVADSAEKQPPHEVTAPVPVRKSTAKATHAGIPPEIVAVIAAAVASMSDDGISYSLKSVKKSEVRSVRGQRTSWAAAGLAENTRPF